VHDFPLFPNFSLTFFPILELHEFSQAWGGTGRGVGWEVVSLREKKSLQLETYWASILGRWKMERCWRRFHRSVLRMERGFLVEQVSYCLSSGRDQEAIGSGGRQKLVLIGKPGRGNGKGREKDRKGKDRKGRNRQRM